MAVIYEDRMPSDIREAIAQSGTRRIGASFTCPICGQVCREFDPSYDEYVNKFRDHMEKAHPEVRVSASHIHDMGRYGARGATSYLLFYQGVVYSEID